MVLSAWRQWEFQPAPTNIVRTSSSRP